MTNTGLTKASGVVTIASVRELIHRCNSTCAISSDRGHATFVVSDLPPGSIDLVRICASAVTSAGDYNLVTNTATITSEAPPHEVDSATATTTVREQAALYVRSNLVDSTSGLLHYVHTVTNQGGDSAHAVLLLDPLPAHTSFVSASTTLGTCSFHPTIGLNGAVRCPLNNPVAGTSVQVDVVLQASTEACPSVTNTVTVTSINLYENTGQNVVTVTSELPASICGTQSISKTR